MTIESKVTKNGQTRYYKIDDSGKKTQISREHALAIMNSNEEENKMGNTVAIMNAMAEDMEEAIRLEEEAMERIELSEATKPAETAETPVIDPPAPKAKKTRKKTNAAEQKNRWLENAKIDESGRYYVVPELDYKNFETNSGWNPCFYIVTNDRKLTRIGLKFAIELAKAGKAIEVSKSDVKELNKAA